MLSDSYCIIGKKLSPINYPDKCPSLPVVTFRRKSRVMFVYVGCKTEGLIILMVGRRGSSGGACPPGFWIGVIKLSNYNKGVGYIPVGWGMHPRDVAYALVVFFRGGDDNAIFFDIFRGGDDNAFITPNRPTGRNCYAIAMKHSMSGDGWQRRKQSASNRGECTGTIKPIR